MRFTTPRFLVASFFGNVRIATRASFRGSTASAYGSTANDEVSELVLRQGEIFRGQTRTLERDWIIIYKPLDDEEGQRVGMIAAFREVESF
ncbi:MAG: hypothetical protein GY822_21415 [Deltaproteobacteria bacterium]|nr:hypothetical protein [Deltaproteobacteria bacterium]